MPWRHIDAERNVIKMTTMCGGDDVMGSMNCSCRDRTADLMSFFESQLRAWPMVRANFTALGAARMKSLSCNGVTLKVQYNPSRIVSTAAKTDAGTIASRRCFLCEANRPAEQMVMRFGGTLDICVNPYPVLPVHFTISSVTHEPQNVMRCYGDIYSLLDTFTALTVVYNGPHSGASAPDHLHMQGGTSGIMPLQVLWDSLMANSVRIDGDDEAYVMRIDDYVVPVFAVSSTDRVSGERLFNRLYASLPRHDVDGEPMMNIVAWRHHGRYVVAVIPRRAHRPRCYYAHGGDNILVSPGVIDMAGLVITPRECDFNALTFDAVNDILGECGITRDEALSVSLHLMGA